MHTERHHSNLEDASQMNSQIFRRDQAQRFAPKTADEIQQAARDLADTGHSDHTIAAILKADVNAVRAMIGQRGPVAPSADVCTARTNEASRR